VLCAPGHCPAERWRTGMKSYVCPGRNCCNNITLRLVLLTNLESVIGKCQTDVMLTTCYLPIDAISDCTTCTLSQAFCHVFFLFAGYAYSRSFFRVFFRCGHCKYLFISEQNDVNIIWRILLSNYFEYDYKCYFEVLFVQLWVIAIFEYKHFTR